MTAGQFNWSAVSLAKLSSAEDNSQSQSWYVVVLVVLNHQDFENKVNLVFIFNLKKSYIYIYIKLFLYIFTFLLRKVKYL